MMNEMIRGHGVFVMQLVTFGGFIGVCCETIFFLILPNDGNQKTIHV